MKIGILTINGLNYGSFLQGFALKKFIEDLGHTAYIINTMTPKRFIWVMMQRCSPDMVFGLKSIFSILSSWKSLKKSSFKHLDAIVIGSDIVWSESSPKFFGNNLSTDKKIAYAPCCAEKTFEDLNDIQIEGMKSINKLSARDKKTAEIIEKATHKKPEMVLDPTFLIDFSKYEIPTDLTNFILVYSYAGKKREMIIKAKELSQKTGKKIISVGFYNSWCDMCVPASPFEFLGFMRHAGYIITDTFHGTAFSLIYKKPFISFLHSHKVEFLLDSFGIKHNELFNDYAKIDDIMKKKEEVSKKYLENALKSE